MKYAAALLVAAASVAGADEVYLRGGGHVTGIVVSETRESVEVEIGSGRVTLPQHAVDRVVRRESPLSLFQERASALAEDDLAGWLALAAWADASELSGQADDAYEHVLALDPENPAAHRARGEVRLDNHWMTQDEAMFARGYVQFEGQWVSPDERGTMLAEREADRRAHLEAEQARAVAAEADARVREAEARARIAEAEARRVEDESLFGYTTPDGGYVIYSSSGHGYRGRGRGRQCFELDPFLPYVVGAGGPQRPPVVQGASAPPPPSASPHRGTSGRRMERTRAASTTSGQPR